MQERVLYFSDDGHQFDSAEECLNHEILAAAIADFERKYSRLTIYDKKGLVDDIQSRLISALDDSPSECFDLIELLIEAAAHFSFALKK